jgi:hypothetical protein
VPIHSLSSMDDLAGVLGTDLSASWFHRDLDGWRDRLRAVQAEA